jgi:SAM-dependent methyltransferase
VIAVLDALGLGRQSTVLDVGAGTGKLTEELVPLVGQVIAVEPAPPMLAVLRHRLPSVDARIGVAEALPLDDHSVESVFVAEAFHWFRTEEAAQEIARVLVPDGHLVLVWQRQRWRDPAASPWIAEFERRLEPFWESSATLAGPHPNVGKQWKAELDRIGLFGPFSTVEAEFVYRVGLEGFLALVASWSWVAILPPEQREQALATIRDLLGDEHELALDYRTEFQWARLQPR